MARESVDVDAAIDTTGVMAASADLDVQIGDVEFGDGGSAERSAGRSGSHAADRRRTAATVSSGGSKRGLDARTVAAASVKNVATAQAVSGDFVISEEEEEENDSQPPRV